jgi:hypothetical protein
MNPSLALPATSGYHWNAVRDYLTETCELTVVLRRSVPPKIVLNRYIVVSANERRSELLSCFHTLRPAASICAIAGLRRLRLVSILIGF